VSIMFARIARKCICATLTLLGAVLAIALTEAGELRVENPQFSDGKKFSLSLEDFVEIPCKAIFCGNQFVRFLDDADPQMLGPAIPYYWAHGIHPLYKEGHVGTWIQTFILAAPVTDPASHSDMKAIVDISLQSFGISGIHGFEFSPPEILETENGLEFLLVPSSLELGGLNQASLGLLLISPPGYFIQIQVFHLGNTTELKEIAQRLKTKFANQNALTPGLSLKAVEAEARSAFSKTEPGDFRLSATSYFSDARSDWWLAASGLACKKLPQTDRVVIDFFEGAWEMRNAVASIKSWDDFMKRGMHAREGAFTYDPAVQISEVAAHLRSLPTLARFCNGLNFWSEILNSLSTDIDAWETRTDDTTINCLFEENKDDVVPLGLTTLKDCRSRGGRPFPGRRNFFSQGPKQ